MPHSTPRFSSFGDGERERIRSLLDRHTFFWIDLPSAEEQAALDFLEVPEHAARCLLSAGSEAPPSRKFHSDDEHVVFPFPYVRSPGAELDQGPAAIDAGEVGVLVHGDYILTVHAAGFSLTDSLSFDPYGHRSERYIVYAVLDGMLWTSFEALDQIGSEVEDLEDLLVSGQGSHSLRRRTVGAAQARLATLRRLIAPQRGIFERISAEVVLVRGLEGGPEEAGQATGYFERIDSQLSRLVDDIDASSRDLASLIDLGISETNYRLSVVATVFLPLTALTGFFGMNFLWMTDRIEGRGTFLLFGIGLPVLCVLLAALLISRGQTLLAAGRGGPESRGG